MKSLVFLLVFVSITIIGIISIVAAVKKKPVAGKLIVIGALIIFYTIAWLNFFSNSKYVQVAFGTDICFDDWCATVNKYEKQGADTVKLFVTISNHARGIAQRPDEPRITLIDDHEKRFRPVKASPYALDSRLQLHQSLQTTIIFILPAGTGKLRALIEEGPFIAHLVLPENQDVFVLK